MRANRMAQGAESPATTHTCRRMHAAFDHNQYVFVPGTFRVFSLLFRAPGVFLQGSVQVAEATSSGTEASNKQPTQGGKQGGDPTKQFPLLRRFSLALPVPRKLHTKTPARGATKVSTSRYPSCLRDANMLASSTRFEDRARAY